MTVSKPPGRFGDRPFLNPFDVIIFIQHTARVIPRRKNAEGISQMRSSLHELHKALFESQRAFGRSLTPFGMTAQYFVIPSGVEESLTVDLKMGDVSLFGI
jgi:hypothetical protein